MINVRQITILLALGFVCLAAQLNEVTLSYPSSWPEPVYDFNDKPLTKEGIELGRKLFYDPILSRNNTISCASCHLSYTAFTHVDHALSHGINDSIGTRNSPVLINLAWNSSFMWDGAVNHIEVQPLAPIAHPAEMGEEIKHVLQKLQNTKKYPPLFQSVFGSSTISSESFLMALAQFQLSLVSANSKYDRVKEGKEVFTDQEKAGYALFKANCNDCHTEPLFTNSKFASNALSYDAELYDIGRSAISLNPLDSFKFKVPTLRNIQFSQPYMHDGRYESLNQVLSHYTDSIEGSNHKFGDLNTNMKLSAKDKVDLVSFLLTLTDKEFLFNPKHSFPRNN